MKSKHASLLHVHDRAREMCEMREKESKTVFFPVWYPVCASVHVQFALSLIVANP